MFNKGDVMKKRIYEIIEVSKEDDTTSHIYDLVMMFTIFMSIIPLAFKQETKLFTILDLITVIIFIIDYLLRWATADLKYDDPRFISYIKYPFSFMAIIDLLSILPSINIINKGFKALKTIRLIRTFRVLRIFKSFRYSKNIQLIIQVGKNGVNDALIKTVYDALEARELIKVSILQNCFEEPKAIAAEIAEVINAEVIQVIGKTIVFYKESSKKKQIVLPK